jgi:hypothetical protein
MQITLLPKIYIRQKVLKHSNMVKISCQVRVGGERYGTCRKKKENIK